MARGLSGSVGGAVAALLLATMPTLAAPPVTGTTHTFVDPVFKGTIFCDTAEQVRRIATAKTPDAVYGNFRLTTNDNDEPICMAIVPTGVVVDVIPLGTMIREGEAFSAWAVETDVNGTTAFALYLEHVAGVANI
jgi:hypothetical protein